MLLVCMVILVVMQTTLLSRNRETSESKCDVFAFLNDPDQGGTNVRDNPGGKIVKKLPLQTDPKFEAGIYVKIKKSKNGWLQIESVQDTKESYKNLWVSGKLLGVGTRNYDEKPLRLFEKADKKSRVVSYLKGEQIVPVLACSGKWIYTSGEGIKSRAARGWLEPEMQCPNAVTNCCRLTGGEWWAYNPRRED